ncbi:hypothetical protein BDZ97DRAFT_832380 [Flammula alnicola]|nr:hypothetical protein BDZ97DRAFT_832380 [Flammula alnicola]
MVNAWQEPYKAVWSGRQIRKPFLSLPRNPRNLRAVDEVANQSSSNPAKCYVIAPPSIPLESPAMIWNSKNLWSRQSVSSRQSGHSDLNTSPNQPVDERETSGNGNGTTLVDPTSASTSVPTLLPHPPPPPPPPPSSIVPRAVPGDIDDIAASEVILKDHPGQSSHPPSSGPLASEGSQMRLEPLRRSSHSQFSAPNAQTYGTSSGPSSGRIQSTTTPRPYQTFGPPSQPSNGPNESPWSVPKSSYRGLDPTTPRCTHHLQPYRTCPQVPQCSQGWVRHQLHILLEHLSLYLKTDLLMLHQ